MEGDVLSAFRETITIGAPPQVVWQLVTDICRRPQFAGSKSITKMIDFDGGLAVGGRWLAHERVGPQKFDAPSQITAIEPERRLEWVSFPPMKEANRGTGGKVQRGYQPGRLGHRADAPHERARTPQRRRHAQGHVCGIRPAEKAAGRRADNPQQHQGRRRTRDQRLTT